MGPPQQKINYRYDRSLVSSVRRTKTAIHCGERLIPAMGQVDGWGRRPGHEQPCIGSGDGTPLPSGKLLAVSFQPSA
jgi:hypothetical protein